MSEELKPCPFCGSKGIFDAMPDGLRRFVVCSNIICIMENHAVADAAWNRPRAYESELAALREENERLREMLQLVYERARHTVDIIEESRAWPFTRETSIVVPTVQEMIGSMPDITGNQTIKEYLEDE